MMPCFIKHLTYSVIETDNYSAADKHENGNDKKELNRKLFAWKNYGSQAKKMDFFEKRKIFLKVKGGVFPQTKKEPILLKCIRIATEKQI